MIVTSGRSTPVAFVVTVTCSAVLSVTVNWYVPVAGSLTDPATASPLAVITKSESCSPPIGLSLPSRSRTVTVELLPAGSVAGSGVTVELAGLMSLVITSLLNGLPEIGLPSSVMAILSVPAFVGV